MGLNLRSVMAAACVVAALSASGCKEVQDIREELGWAKQPDAPPPAPVVSLDDRWVPAETGVADLNQTQWVQRWWQWAGLFDHSAPYQDRDGSRCALHQDGPVWFLAGTDGRFDAVRSCSIPADKHVFFPLINWIVASDDSEVNDTEAPPTSCTQKQASAARLADHVFTGLVLLDGRPIGELKRMRVAGTTCFAVSADTPAAATDGYWLMLKPLPPGQHTLAVAAGYREGPRQSMQNFQYTLEVQGAADADGAAVDETAVAEGEGGGSLDDAADIAE
ncbi:hypothetical protein JI752_018210 [Lysobacter sp. MMG2]|uniref:hypothetical protein n=1 Tax=Lysobacter sp. MMG2 TaxID=2801338 RepID=UPI001C24BF93|nr:hypothetical protein [Lysobacter sp. MMG2]MBU8978088.1 hypothetical protein [Lysobacter sp. MMG2]